MSDASLPYTKPNIDWDEIERWDRAYYLHNTQAQAEYVFTGIEGADGNYLYTAGGGKLLDFQSQLVSDNMGHRHPRVHAEIKRAMERFGHVFFGHGLASFCGSRGRLSSSSSSYSSRNE